MNCRFPNFLRELTGDVAPKLRPGLVTGVEVFSDGRTIVRIAYGTSRFHIEEGPAYNRRIVEHPRPGDFVVRAGNLFTGLQTDTCFRLRVETELPFDNHFFAALETRSLGQQPVRGHVDLNHPNYARAFRAARDAATRLGSQLEGEGANVRLAATRRMRP